MGHIWQLQEAKNKFSNLVNKARRDGPQIVTKHGEASVVVLSFEDYKQLTAPKEKLASFLRNSPLFGQDLDVERQKDNPREVEL